MEDNGSEGRDRRDQKGNKNGGGGTEKHKGEERSVAEKK